MTFIHCKLILASLHQSVTKNQMTKVFIVVAIQNEKKSFCLYFFSNFDNNIKKTFWSFSCRLPTDVMKRALDLCLVHVIWTERQMSKLVLNVKYLLLLSFLTAAEFYNLGHIFKVL